MNNEIQMPASNPGDEEFLAAARQELERSAAEIDSLTVARLRAMRMRALEEIHNPARPLWWQPAGAFAVLAIVVLSWMMLAPHPGAAVPEADAYEMLATDGGHDVADNPDFYEWLDAQYQAGDAPELDQI